MLAFIFSHQRRFNPNSQPPNLESPIGADYIQRDGEPINLHVLHGLRQPSSSYAVTESNYRLERRSIW
jgi:hypothetical protein